MKEEKPGSQGASTAEWRQNHVGRGRETLRPGSVSLIHSPFSSEEPAKGRDVPGTTEAPGKPGHPRVNPTWLPSWDWLSTEFRAPVDLEKPHLYPH